MACGVPTIVSNEAFNDVLGQHKDLLCVRDPNDVDGLRQRLEKLLALPLETRQHIGHDLRAHVIQQHGLSELIGRVVNLV